jgi:hypothetical protein
LELETVLEVEALLATAEFLVAVEAPVLKATATDIINKIIKLF